MANRRILKKRWARGCIGGPGRPSGVQWADAADALDPFPKWWPSEAALERDAHRYAKKHYGSSGAYGRPRRPRRILWQWTGDVRREEG